MLRELDVENDFLNILNISKQSPPHMEEDINNSPSMRQVANMCGHPVILPFQ